MKPQKTKEIKITRDTIDLESVHYEQKWGNIAYLQITSFTEDTADEFNKEITKAIYIPKKLHLTVFHDEKYTDNVAKKNCS